MSTVLVSLDAHQKCHKHTRSDISGLEKHPTCVTRFWSPVVHDVTARVCLWHWCEKQYAPFLCSLSPNRVRVSGQSICWPRDVIYVFRKLWPPSFGLWFPKCIFCIVSLASVSSELFSFVTFPLGSKLLNYRLWQLGFPNCLIFLKLGHIYLTNWFVVWSSLKKQIMNDSWIIFHPC